MDKSATTTISAPGKVLIAGGYLVLESPNIGVVIASDQRFYSTVSIIDNRDEDKDVNTIMANDNDEEDKNNNNNNDDKLECIPIDIHSPQFHTNFYYWLYYDANDNINNNNSSDEKRTIKIKSRKKEQKSNVMIEQTLLLTFTFMQCYYGHQGSSSSSSSSSSSKFHEIIQKNMSNKALNITLCADNDFYSQLHYLKSNKIPLLPNTIQTIPKCLPCPVDENDHSTVIINKTGLGSSAALVTSLVSSILTFWGIVDIKNKNEDDLSILHRLSQTIHCIAQGKIGSGFDVACAIYGSMIYTRFSKNILEDILSNYNNISSSTSNSSFIMETTHAFSMLLQSLVMQDPWDYTIKPLILPPFLEILMADVCGGSESPSMARKVLQWKKDNNDGKALNLWRDLGLVNNEILTILNSIITLYNINNNQCTYILNHLATLPSTKWLEITASSNSSKEFIIQLLNLQTHFIKSRTLLKTMGDLSNVPIEPNVQSKLASDTMTLPGVLCAGIPGAGGYDALYVIYIKGISTYDGSSDSVRDGIGKFWMSWKNDDGDGNVNICPLCLKSVGYGNGLREEI